MVNNDPVLPVTSSSMTSTIFSTTTTNLLNTTTEDLENLPITTESLIDNMTIVARVNETTTPHFISDVTDDPMVISAPGWAVSINSFLDGHRR